MDLLKSRTSLQLALFCLGITGILSLPIDQPLPLDVNSKHLSDASITWSGQERSIHSSRLRREVSELPTISRLVQLSNKLTGYIGIGRNGLVSGIRPRRDIYTHIYMQSFGPGLVRFKGKASQRYIAIDKGGMVYTTPFIGPESLFRERLDISYYHTYSSVKYPGYFLGFRKNGLPRKAQRTRRSSRSAKFQTLPMYGVDR